jgi:hypothetical protein
MAGIFSFKCSSCEKIHEGSPSFAFKAPDPYLEQTEEVKKSGKLDSDLCYYEDKHGYHYFIRVVLEIPIHGVKESFMWGVWVSLSEKNYIQYVEMYDEPDPSDCYFGWFCNYLPFYESTYALKTQVHPRTNGDRPYIELQECDHQLAIDFHNGITIEKAQEIAESVMHKNK